MSAEDVIKALWVLKNEGVDGLRAAAEKEPILLEYLIKDVGEVLAAMKNPMPANDARANGTTENNRNKSLTANEIQKLKESLFELHGSKPFTNMTRYIILQHVADHSRERTTQTIFRELEVAHLYDKQQRMSLVSTLNRLKKNLKYIDWPEDSRGKGITITAEGQKHLDELIAKKLQPWQMDYIRAHASRVISAKLP